MNAPAIAAPKPTTARAARAVTVAVLGGGPIGMACALLLARNGIACELIDARPIEALQRDRRLLALSRGTLLVLESILGPRLAERLPLAPIERVHVSSQGNLGAVQLGAQDFDGLAVGATAWYADLCGALMRAIEDTVGSAKDAPIRVQRPCRVTRLAQRNDRVFVHLDDGAVLDAALAVNAEGAPAPPAEPRAAALLANVTLAGVPRGLAVERFTRDGPLAFLPMPGAAGAAEAGAREMSMVWCLPAALARQYLAVPEGELVARIGQALGARIGLPSALEGRSVFPLVTHRLERVCEHRVVHLGNAAQSLHPVAGQGFNLGMRDCACLAECIARGRQAAGAPARADDPLPALAEYERRRWLDRQVMPRLTSALPRVFGTRLAPVVAARGAAMLLLDGVPAARRVFTRLLMYGS